MSPELQDKLYKKYPALFAQHKLSMRETCMVWGICTGDGWYKILDQMCQKIQETGIPVQFSQVKEKFGTLRVYTDGSTDAVEDIITWAAKVSAVTCEECGEPGKMQRGGWLSVRCKECKKK
ncbi:MAG: hypothetical protein AB7V39_00440 [Nitrospiraceae bacterium]